MQDHAEQSLAIRSQIQDLVDAFRAAQERCSNLMSDSLETAHRLGEALGQAEHGMAQGEFDLLLEAVKLERTVGRKLVRFARETPRESLMESGRQGMLALGFVPKKERTKDPTDKRVDMLPHLSASVAAWARYVRAVQLGHIEMDEAEAVRETREMYLWLSKLHAD